MQSIIVCIVTDYVTNMKEQQLSHDYHVLCHTFCGSKIIGGTK